MPVNVTRQRVAPTNNRLRTVVNRGSLPQRMRQIADGRLEASFDPLRLRSDPMPPVTDSTIRVKQTFQGAVEGDETGVNTITIKVSDLAQIVPGGTSFWNRIRIEKITVWLKPSVEGTASRLDQEQLQVQLPGDDTKGIPPVSYRDNGILGQSYPAIAFKPGLAQRQRWYNPASEDVIFIATSQNSSAPPSSVNAEFIVAATLELVSPQLNA